MSGSRLVVITRRSLHRPTRCSTIRATSDTTCSQLSSRSSVSRPRRNSLRRSSIVTEAPAPTSASTPSAAAIASATPAESPSGAKSAMYTPSANSPNNDRPTSTARRVFPTPPAPTIVTTRCRRTSAVVASISVAATEERGRRRRQVGRRHSLRGAWLHLHRRRRERRVLGEHGLLEPLQVGTGFDTELLRQLATRRVDTREGHRPGDPRDRARSSTAPRAVRATDAPARALRSRR